MSLRRVSVVRCKLGDDVMANNDGSIDSMKVRPKSYGIFNKHGMLRLSVYTLTDAKSTTIQDIEY